MFVGFVNKDEDFDHAWEQAKPFLERSLEYSAPCTIELLEDEFYNRRKRLWLIGEGEEVCAACMTCIGPDNTLLIEHCGGEGVDEWLPAVWATFQRYAEIAQVNKLAIVGRKGWLRLLRQYGDIDYKELAVFTSQPEYIKVH